MSELIKVGMADYQVSKAGTGGIITYGLGSCVAIAMYDTSTKIGGLAHIMLPDSTQARSVENLAKFADTAIKLMLEDMLKMIRMIILLMQRYLLVLTLVLVLL